MYGLNQWQQKYIARDKKSILLRWAVINFSFLILGTKKAVFCNHKQVNT